VAAATPEGQRELIAFDLSHVIPPVSGAEKIPGFIAIFALLMFSLVVLDFGRAAVQIYQSVQGWGPWVVVGLGGAFLLLGFIFTLKVLLRLRQMKPPSEF
jgi:hypothetical protein